MKSTHSVATSTAPSPFRTREAVLFEAYYRALQIETGLIIPPRSALKPSDAKGFLPYLCIQEVKGPDEILLRLVGTVIVNRMGFDPTGRNMLEVMSPEQKEQSVRHVRQLFEKPCGTQMVVNEAYENKPIPCEVVSLPFADHNGTPRFVIALCAEIDRQDLLMRGPSSQRFGEIVSTHVLDIGAGI